MGWRGVARSLNSREVPRWRFPQPFLLSARAGGGLLSLAGWACPLLLEGTKKETVF